MGSVPLVASLADTRNLATCLFFGGCLILTYKAFTDFEVRISSKNGKVKFSISFHFARNEMSLDIRYGKGINEETKI